MNPNQQLHPTANEESSPPSTNANESNTSSPLPAATTPGPVKLSERLLQWRTIALLMRISCLGLILSTMIYFILAPVLILMLGGNLKTDFSRFQLIGTISFTVMILFAISVAASLCLIGVRGSRDIKRHLRLQNQPLLRGLAYTVVWSLIAITLTIAWRYALVPGPPFGPLLSVLLPPEPFVGSGLLLVVSYTIAIWSTFFLTILGVLRLRTTS